MAMLLRDTHITVRLIYSFKIFSLILPFLDYSHSPCLSQKLGDFGLSHSPIHGFSTDGYPIYGPYQAINTLASSCWSKRDYSSSVLGCGTSGLRTCLLKNPLDYKQGTQFTFYWGPSATTSASGAYKQDYYYNAS